MENCRPEPIKIADKLEAQHYWNWERNYWARKRKGIPIIRFLCGNCPLGFGSEAEVLLTNDRLSAQLLLL